MSPRRSFLTGASIILPDRLVTGQTVVIENGRIAELVSGPRVAGRDETRIDLEGCVVAPGFIDVHIHGVAGHDVLDGAGAIAAVAAELPRFGVTAFCPTTIACPPAELSALLEEVARLRSARAPEAARVLPAHLESNFISPEYRGAQPAACLRTAVTSPTAGLKPRPTLASDAPGDEDEFTGADILAVIDRHRADVGIVTLAPELPGGLALTKALAAAGVHVSLGHSGADFDEAQAAIAAGARQATHLFNRMRPMSHRDPGLTGAVLASDEIAAELICDGCHVHPAIMRVAIAAKGTSKILAISDGTAGSSLPAGTRTRLGGQPITVADVARLDDGTIAGSVLTMDRVFACLVGACGVDLVRAAELCATTPARELGLVGHGVIAPGAVADLVALDARLQVRQTWIGGTSALRHAS
jgi:N-acetylglucosamine-6-phosphate deacetylase